MNPTFYPYLNFDGTCAEAFAHYQAIFGGHLEVMRLGDVPGGTEIPAEFAERTIHAALVFPDGGLLMGSDVEPGGVLGPVRGMYVNVTLPTPDDSRQVFGALADGGEVEMDLAPSFFSPMFGICVDRFGTPWMINTRSPEED